MAADAADLLRAAILDGEYLPGERLVEAQLCERLGTGRRPRREPGDRRAGERARRDRSVDAARGHRGRVPPVRLFGRSTPG
jgi:DNA-binding FadR family transcriptional regulator